MTTPPRNEVNRRTGRFPVTPAVIWALGVQTLRQCLRRKVLLVLLLFFAVILIGTRVIPSHTPAKRVEMLISLSLQSISFFGVIVAIFLLLKAAAY